jgi:16S rRNA processing protein RimM
MVDENPDQQDPAEQSLFQVGHINGVYGVKGWVKIFSDTRPRENIFSYSPWWIELKQGWREISVVNSRMQGKGLVAQIEGIDDRDQALELVSCKIVVSRDQLPAPDEDEYYWSDLMGLEVINLSGESLGKVKELLETGGHDVLVVESETDQHLIPFVPQVYILDVDLDSGKIKVDWGLDY